MITTSRVQGGAALLDNEPLTGGEALLHAAARGQLADVALALDDDAALDVNWADEDGLTALLAAASEGHVAVVELLVSISCVYQS
jgi:ankyrin repeat protein